jgi:hypothetical protein
VVNATGTKFMIKVLESAEFLAILDVSSISANKLAYAYLNTTNLLTEPVVLAQSTLTTTISLNHVFATTDTPRTLASAHLLAMPLKNGLMDCVYVKLDTI